MYATPRFRPAAALLLGLICIGLLAGCGKKAWPEPSAPEDVFSFTDVAGTSTGECTVITSRLAGNWRNLSAVYLQLSWDDCTDCPFKPLTTREFVPGGENCEVGPDGRLRITACEMDPGVAYRWRLIGKNVHPTLGDARSEVYSTR